MTIATARLLRASAKAAPVPSDREAVQPVSRGPSGLRPSATYIRRACSCGGGGTGPCGCPDTSEIRSANDGQQTAGRRPSTTPANVVSLLGRPGRPLRDQVATRHFADVQAEVSVHEGPEADAAARSIHADAFTAGTTIVLGSAAHRSPAERSRLLAHELTHVRQNGARPAHAPYVLGDPDSPLEDQAHRVAEKLSSGAGPSGTAAIGSAPPGVIRRQRTPTNPPGSDGGTTATPAPGSGSATPTPAPHPVCGPDVRQQLVDVVAATKSAYASWSANDKEEACWALQNIACGPTAWDIVELHNSDWIYQTYRPACATEGGSPPCGQTVKVGNGCHYHGTPNYVIFGVMANLCGIWRSTVHALVWAYKHSSPNYEQSLAWALAGYDGWPGVADPAGDRNNCTPNCSTPYSGGPFTLFWYPKAPTETVSGDCEAALREHRAIRDDPTSGVPMVPPL